MDDETQPRLVSFSAVASLGCSHFMLVVSGGLMGNEEFVRKC